MNAFVEASDIEQQSMRVLKPFLDARFDGRVVLNQKSRLARELQARYGDLFAEHKSRGVVAVEVKAEKENAYGNFFLEEWSNRQRFNHGWLHKLQADVLLYHFLHDDDLYVIDFQKLKRWAFCCENGKRPRLYDFQMRRQSKYQQQNDTWGVAVPIDVIGKEVGFEVFHPLAVSLEVADA